MLKGYPRHKLKKKCFFFQFNKEFVIFDIVVKVICLLNINFLLLLIYILRPLTNIIAIKVPNIFRERRKGNNINSLCILSCCIL